MQQQRSTTKPPTRATTKAAPPTTLRIKTPIDAWGEDTDDHTKRSTYTAATQETVASSIVSGDGSACKGKAAIPSSSSTSPRANLLMKMLAKEMAATLLREGGLTGGTDGSSLDSDIMGLVHLHHAQATKGMIRRSSSREEDSDDDADDDDEEGTGAGASASVTASSYLESLASEDFDVESVVQMVVASVQKQQHKQKQQQQQQQQSPKSQTTKPARPQHRPQQSPRTPATTSSKKKSSSSPDALRSPSSCHTIHTKTSELSLGSGSRKSAQMDIWHPDFWAVQEGGSGAQKEDGRASSTPTPSAVVIEDVRPVDEPESCDDFEGDDVEEDDDDVDDDVSVLSDISGLTDAWNLDGLRKKEQKSQGGSTPAKKSGGLALSMLFGGGSKTKNSTSDAATKSTHTDASSLIGSHVDNRSVSTRRSKSSMSSGGGGSKGKSKTTSHGHAKHPHTPSTAKSVSSSASSSRRSRATGSSRPNAPPAKTVSFSTVHVREYERILCDNPAAGSGLSIGIGWKFVELNNGDEDNDDDNIVTSAAMTVDDWQLRQKRGRSPSELLLSRREREVIVRQWGFTEREITAMKRELNKARAQRRQTVNNLGAQKVEEAVETVRSKVKSLLFLQVREDRVGGGAGTGTGTGTGTTLVEL